MFVPHFCYSVDLKLGLEAYILSIFYPKLAMSMISCD